ncbi:23S rRNA (pseudouridine(1915)-N(3))-methyltransferase RlmH [Pseudaestuariivita rosea]|uniref:23S rRNA (pseudouridine(1915)-N(3))-methyltransferase RlmH n=1 Tax=Pseudaestuariivita rosea TaxID=2763263 RepID=UPI001ABB24FC|nr:23S rRNA (pseudouridine(1915)-N(3))-methyltransferase RlmH [Pseudaestuariivita rosea]
MKVHLCVVGRLRAGPEKDLVDDYLSRFDKIGRALALRPVQVHEVEDKKGGGKQAEADLLSRVIPDGAWICALDERGTLMTSPDFAKQIARVRDDGQSDLAFLIGGADGLSPDLRGQAHLSLSFGKMVWPHMLVRVMLAEQLYRAASILSGSPYHRV